MKESRFSRMWRKWEAYEDYFQDELPCIVLEDDSVPGIITLYAVCECGRKIAKASSGRHDMAFRSLQRQVGDRSKCLVCISAEEPKVDHAIRHNHTLSGATPRRPVHAGIS
jgi:hypothetical protein